MAIDNMTKNLVKITCVAREIYLWRQTHRRPHHNTSQPLSRRSNVTDVPACELSNNNNGDVGCGR